MNAKLIDSSEIHTSSGVFRREIKISDLTDFGCAVSVSLFFDGKEYKDTDELLEFLGNETFNKMKSEVEAYSSAFDCFMSAFPRIL